jgi:Tfp pilus assembly ATPase PilU
LSTLHTVDATETVNRLLDFFPAHQQHQVRLTLAGALRGIICQRLVPSVSGGRMPCCEVLVNTGRIADRIVDPATTSEIKDVIAQGSFYGMRTFDQSLLELVRLGDVKVEDAMEAASVPQDLELMLEQAGLNKAPDRAPSFQEDVKLLFRQADRDRMQWAFDLWDVDSVRQHADDILRRLERHDLPFESGCPPQHVDVFRAWMQGGMAP